ncbi:hypothetical protein FACS1894110_00440 [Spirochaetia bacterium]|nr:hypothetical protein FACS1894110_00440 [Spirochaetia bacterium]
MRTMTLTHTNEIVNRYPYLPKMVKVIQEFKDDGLGDVASVLRKELEQDRVKQLIKKGMNIAVTGGSRGIDNIALITKETVSFLKECGAKPFIVPAMGSHGGATAEGQKKVLEHLGVTEEYCGCPIRSSMETRAAGTINTGETVLMDKYAAAADGIVLINRIHSHGDVAGGPHESGLVKMMAIGLGKQQGAEQIHQLGRAGNFERIPAFARVIYDHANVLFGVAMVENTLQKTALIRALVRDEIWTEDPKLLEKAKSYIVPLLPCPADILITDEIGKDITGGHKAYPVAKSVLLDVRDSSEGNCLGMGGYDIGTKRLYDKIDFDKTYVNTLNSTLLFYADVPMIMENDKMALQLAMMSCNVIDKTKVRVVRIKNDSHFTELYVSENMAEELRAFPNIKIDGKAEALSFNNEGNLF